MNFDQNKLEEARSKVWGHFMMADKFLDALQFANSLKSLATQLGDNELLETAKALISKSAEEILLENSEQNKSSSPVHSCSFCGRAPPAVRLGAGPSVFICDGCTSDFAKFFNDENS